MNEIKVVLFGDSLTWAYPKELLGSLPVRNLGVCGNETGDLLARVLEVVNEQPTHVILLVGINDFLRYRKIYPTVEGLNLVERIISVINLIQDNIPNIQLIVQSLYPVNQNDKYVPESKVAIYNQEIININKILMEKMNQKGIPYWDVHPYLTSLGALNPIYTEDGIHLLKPAYELIHKSFITPFFGENTKRF